MIKTIRFLKQSFLLSKVTISLLLKEISIFFDYHKDIKLKLGSLSNLQFILFMNKKNNQKHGFHLVDPSPWPLISAFSALMLTFGAVLFMHGYSNGNFLVKFGFIMIIFSMFCWWRDVIREATFEGQHTTQVQVGLKLGMILFIVSEIMFFFAFF